MRQQGTPTRYPGVLKVDEGVFRVRIKLKDPRTGISREVDKLVRGVSAPEAAKVRSDLRAEFEGGVVDEVAGRRRIGDFAKSWLVSKTRALDYRTSQRYAEALDLHILPTLGMLYFDALKPADVQGWVNERLAALGPAGRPYSVESVKAWFRVLRTMTRDAVIELDLPRDPTARISFPEAVERPEANALKPDELGAFLAAMRTKYPRNFALTTTLAFTGLRFCHASALRIEDIDERSGVLRIARKNSRGQVGPVSRKKRAPKEIPLVPELAVILREHCAELRDEGAPGFTEGWVFPSDVGTLRLPGSLWKAWQACLKEAGIAGRFTVHGLRRTFHDLARRAGVDGLVTKSLTGHVTERMREHYSTVGLDEKRSALTAVVKLVPTVVGTEVGTGVQTVTPASTALSGEMRAAVRTRVGTPVKVGTEVGTRPQKKTANSFELAVFRR